MKKIKEVGNMIKELKKTSRGRGILFFGFYMIFFLVLFLILHFASRAPLKEAVYDKGNPYKYNINNITSDNYQYTYEISIDDKTIFVEGEKYNDKEKFKMGNKEYYKNEDSYFVNENGVWIKCSSPYLEIVDYVIDVDNVKKILEEAYYVSKTSYESGKETYNFLMSSNNFNLLVHNLDTDIDDVSNEITLSTDENLYTNLLKFKLDSYAKVNKLCQNTMEIRLNFDNYGEVEEIRSPL